MEVVTAALASAGETDAVDVVLFPIDALVVFGIFARFSNCVTSTVFPAFESASASPLAAAVVAPSDFLFRGEGVWPVADDEVEESGGRVLEGESEGNEDAIINAKEELTSDCEESDSPGDEETDTVEVAGDAMTGDEDEGLTDDEDEGIAGLGNQGLTGDEEGLRICRFAV